jgi:hypothetical protein
MATGKQLKAAILARRAAKGPRKKRARTEPRQYTVADLERARDRVAAAERRIDNDRCPDAAAVHRAENLDDQGITDRDHAWYFMTGPAEALLDRAGGL